MASRSRIEMSQQVFQRLIQYAKNDGAIVPNADKPRWILRLSDEDASLMAKADVVDHQQITRQIRAIQIQHEACLYFAVLGIGEIDNVPDGLVPVETTPGLFSVAVTQSDIQPIASGLEILNAIGALHGDEEGFQGFDLPDISGLFPSIAIFRADQNYDYTSSVVRVLGVLTARSYDDGPIAPKAPTLDKVAILFESGSEHVPFENVLQGLLSISWGGFFLELYRAVEQLYAVPRISALVEDWPTALPYKKLADLLENHLSWRPKEDDALAKIIGECEPGTTQLLIDSFCKDRDKAQQVPAEKIAADVYKVRNGLVHFRVALGDVKYADEEWEAMIFAMLDFVLEVYQRHGDRFNLQGKAT